MTCWHHLFQITSLFNYSTSLLPLNCPHFNFFWNVLEWMYVYKLNEVDQTWHEISCVHKFIIQCFFFLFFCVFHTVQTFPELGLYLWCSLLMIRWGTEEYWCFFIYFASSCNSCESFPYKNPSQLRHVHSFSNGQPDFSCVQIFSSRALEMLTSQLQPLLKTEFQEMCCDASFDWLYIIKI